MTNLLKADVISKALYDFDPMQTGCQQYLDLSRYDSIAEDAELRQLQGYDLRHSLVLALADLFLSSKTLRIDCLDPVLDYLEGR